MKVTAVIPAYNEEERIASVLEAVTRARLVNDIVVVSDGSTDNTVGVAEQFETVRVIELPQNMGKGAAMAAGVKETKADIILFLDADLHGLTSAHVDALVLPVLGGSDMSIGIFKNGKFWTDTAQKIAPFISGQRAVKRELLERVPWLNECRMGAEVTINQIARKYKMKIRRVTLNGVSHPPKERKLGLVKGTAARAKMYAEIGKAYVKNRKRLSR